MADAEERLKVFKTKEFGRFSRKERIDDPSLCEAIKRAEDGLLDADLGDGVDQTAGRASRPRPLARLTGRSSRSSPRSEVYSCTASRRVGKPISMTRSSLSIERSPDLSSARATPRLPKRTTEGEFIEVKCNDD